MKRNLFFFLLFATLLIISTLAQRGTFVQAASVQPVPQATPSASYTVTDLGTLGGTMSQSMGTNEDDQIVGASQAGSYAYAFLWDDGTMTNLGDLGGQGSWAHDINDAGQVVGGSPLSSGNNHAFLWENGSAMQDLGTLGGPVSYAFDVDSAGQAVGYAWNDEGIQHAVLWGSGGIVDLGDLDPLWPNHSAAYGLNDAGQVVGGSYTDIPGQFHAFLWQTGSMQDLGTLGGGYSSAEAINEDSQVVGASWLPDDITLHAFLWDGAMQDLGALGWDKSIAYDINDKGQVVGTLQTGQTSHAFVWANGQMQDLNTLIPANSGWVLSEARAINNKGKIVGYGVVNGQTRAFLLIPQAYHWINPSGGAWHLSSNWDPQGDPGAGDTVIFALNGQYTVDVSTLLAPNAFSIDRMVISGTNFIYFDNMDLNLVYDSPEEPSLEVNAGGTAAINSGAATFSHAIIGGEPPANPNNPPIARLQVLGNGTSLTGSGRLTIGDEGMGDLFVTAGGHLTSAEARIGGLLSTGTGSASVGGDGSLWDTGNIAVGYGVSSTLEIQYGGRVNSNDAYVSWGVLSEDSQVTVNSISAITHQPSMWALLGSLFVGQSWFGSVEVLNGGDLYVSQNVYLTNGELRVDGRHANGDPSDLDVLGSVFVGGPGSANLLALQNAAKGDIDGDLIIGKDGVGAVILWGSAITTNPTWLEVVDPQAGLCVIGHTYDGGVSLDDGGLLRCRNIQLGQAGMSGTGSLTVDGGMVRTLDVLQVGSVGGGAGQIDMQNNALVATNGTYIAPNGVITGTGTLAVGFLGLQNDGTLAPGIHLLYPLASIETTQPQGAVSVTTMAISGTLTIGPTGELAIPMIGNGAGLYGSLAITGTAILDGVLTLDFSNGYGPSQGETFIFLTATDAISGTFDSVEISGLEPGFEYEITYVNGQLLFEALNDGIPAMQRIYLPLVVR